MGHQRIANCDCVPNYRDVSHPSSGVLINFITSMTCVLTPITQNAISDFKILIINISICNSIIGILLVFSSISNRNIQDSKD